MLHSYSINADCRIEAPEQEPLLGRRYRPPSLPRRTLPLEDDIIVAFTNCSCSPSADAPPVPPPRVASPPAIRNATVLWDFNASADTELSLKAGETIQLLSTEDASWWFGKRGDATGYFPANYVRKSAP